MENRVETTLGQWLKAAVDRLRRSGCPDPEIDARWIAEDTLGLRRMELIFAKPNALTEEQASMLEERLVRREGGEPVQYILGSADFMGLRFAVDERVLIPRQDTETLAEACLQVLKAKPNGHVLELCTGSGAVGISIRCLCPTARVMLTDVDPGALSVAQMNAERLGAQVECRLGDLFDAVGGARYDMIIANPPYIRTDEMDGLQREVQREPRLALDGGADGLDFYRRIARETGDHLRPGGCVLLEVGCAQAQDVAELLRRSAPKGTRIDIIRDLNGIERVVTAQFPEEP